MKYALLLSLLFFTTTSHSSDDEHHADISELESAFKRATFRDENAPVYERPQFAVLPARDIYRILESANQGDDKAQLQLLLRNYWGCLYIPLTPENIRFERWTRVNGHEDELLVVSFLMRLYKDKLATRYPEVWRSLLDAVREAQDGEPHAIQKNHKTFTLAYLFLSHYAQFNENMGMTPALLAHKGYPPSQLYAVRNIACAVLTEQHNLYSNMEELIPSSLLSADLIQTEDNYRADYATIDMEICTSPFSSFARDIIGLRALMPFFAQRQDAYKSLVQEDTYVEHVRITAISQVVQARLTAETLIKKGYPHASYAAALCSIVSDLLKAQRTPEDTLLDGCIHMRKPAQEGDVYAQLYLYTFLNTNERWRWLELAAMQGCDKAEFDLPSAIGPIAATKRAQDSVLYSCLTPGKFSQKSAQIIKTNFNMPRPVCPDGYRPQNRYASPTDLHMLATQLDEACLHIENGDDIPWIPNVIKVTFIRFQEFIGKAQKLWRHLDKSPVMTSQYCYSANKNVTLRDSFGNAFLYQFTYHDIIFLTIGQQNVELVLGAGDLLVDQVAGTPDILMLTEALIAYAEGKAAIEKGFEAPSYNSRNYQFQLLIGSIGGADSFLECVLKGLAEARSVLIEKLERSRRVQKGEELVPILSAASNLLTHPEVFEGAIKITSEMEMKYQDFSMLLRHISRELRQGVLFSRDRNAACLRSPDYIQLNDLIL